MKFNCRLYVSSIALLIVGVIVTAPEGMFRQAAAESKPAARKKRKKRRRPFHWVNPLPKRHYPPGLMHKTFRSPSMKIDVGYCIYLPSGYNDSRHSDRRYPVVYYLHGGRPGNETRSIGLTNYIHDAMSRNRVAPAIYVFVNGGAVSHYNTPDKHSLGEDVFIKELIPHVDKTYRTIAARRGRALEGFSQGGRGTARIMFKHPELFCSAAPGGGGYATEKRISENNGEENPHLKFAPGDNTYDLARRYAKNPHPPLRILIFVGDQGFNYQNNLAYMKFLTALHIPFERMIVHGVPHSAKIIYDKRGLEIMRFHAGNFKRAARDQNPADGSGR